MAKEIEAKFINIDISDYRNLLKIHDCKLVHKKRMLKRTVFKRCDDTIKGYARVRDEGDKVTLTSKLYRDPKYAEEYEVTINESYDTGIKFMESMGLKITAVQESYREKWSHPLAQEITIDILPGLPPYTEIECETEDNLYKLIELLKLDKKDMRFGSFDKTYNEYYDIECDVINNKTPYLTFDNVINQLSPKKNKALLEEIYKMYKSKSISRSNRLGRTKSKSCRSKKNTKKKSKRHSRKGTKKH